MIQLFRSPNWDFIGKRRYAYIVSVIVILVGIGSLVAKGGLHYDVDFAGGTLIQVRFAERPSIAAIRSSLARIQLGDSVIQEFGDSKEFIIRLPLTGLGSEDIHKRVQSALGSEASLGKFEIRRVEFVGPQVGRDLQLQAIYAVITGMIGILIYIAVRFDLKGGVAAIIAVVHDVLVSVGMLSLTNREFSLPVLAALLTIIGYSVNDTIVAYDRLRENRGKTGATRGQTFAQQMNTAVNQTLSRTVLTALTTFFSTLILLLFGGKVLEDFAFALFVGVITGTYSTIYIAGALVVDWTNWIEGRLRKGKKAVAKA
ncbi:MAG: protein translocase subunit SecF [Candidatus Rokubacteria bacterium]|nr:protein translocase subunit SecF [Candidatus Rokubacteria bacterium]